MQDLFSLLPRAFNTRLRDLLVSGGGPRCLVAQDHEPREKVPRAIFAHVTAQVWAALASPAGGGAIVQPARRIPARLSSYHVSTTGHPAHPSFPLRCSARPSRPLLGLHLSTSWGGLQQRIPLLENVLAFGLPIQLRRSYIRNPRPGVSQGTSCGGGVR